MSKKHGFPPPWTAEELKESFVVKDASGQSPAFCISTMIDTVAQSPIGLRLTRRRIAANIAKLPELLQKTQK